VRRLNAINSKLLRLDARVESVMDEVLSCPPDDMMPAFLEALNMVGGTVDMMVENVQTYIRQINGTGDETGLRLVYSDPNELTEIHCYGLHPWSDEGERHGGIDLKPIYVDLDPGETRYAEVVAPASGDVTRIFEGTTGAGAESRIVILEMNPFWYAILVFEPQSLDPTVIQEQENRLDVQVGDHVNRGDRIGDLVIRNVMENRYPHIHFSLLYKDPAVPMETLFADPDSIHRSDGNDLVPTTGPGSPWDPVELVDIESAAFFCPYVYSTPEAQQVMDNVPKYNVNGVLCDCVCAYNSLDGDCGDCNPLP
jgi:hypothetical protein